ncbi:hypothetical protein M9Y10_017842 [Tritrichomonas musculus]|uniref:Uncharacterized protein n=1 Tax=Tritrichomonas musculus TaxID=1915356 RepID=A0ABR2HVQ0_9EUKA
MSALPFLTSTRIDVPRPACHTVSRSASSFNPSKSKRALTASMPRGLKPASSSCNPEYSAIPRLQRISIENKIDDIFRGISISTVEFDKIPLVIICLKERKRKAILKGEYQLSQTLEVMVNRFVTIQLQKKEREMKTAKLNDLNFQLEQAQEDMLNLTEKWNKRIEAFNQEQSEATAQFERKQVSKLEEFDANIPTALPPNYCKLSSQLLDMREVERHLVLTKRYNEATALKKQCDKMEKEETEVQKQKFMKIVQAKRQKLIEEQAKAAEVFTAKWTLQSNVLIQQRDDEIATQQKILDNILLKFKESELEY